MHLPGRNVSYYVWDARIARVRTVQSNVIKTNEQMTMFGVGKKDRGVKMTYLRTKKI
ncbi:hypothetical protein BN2497_8031 [Janthinobacterium sp. CG23_2]|nr:hypothetical protein BN2497_8031 [Janthinobacterium sp. CG23_2]CUU30413.1 hypothetical protein BN3177_8031 [Janthinobacterium sp. CG23_2]